MGRKAVVDLARSFIGYQEGPNNDTIFGDWYGLPNQPWCAMFVSYCTVNSGIPEDIVPRFASCTAGFRVFTKMGVATREHIEPKEGDIIFFVWNRGESTPDHVGLVEYVENGVVHTIEGNRSDKVEQFEYDLDDWRIYGYATPDYPEDPVPEPPLKYKVHVEKDGWQDWVKAGEIAGTTGECKRMEAIIMESPDIDLKYRAHVEKKGWMDWVNKGEVAGTTGECLRLEALEIESSVALRVSEHIEKVGWMPVSEGYHIKIGTEGKSLRMEAIVIQLM